MESQADKRGGLRYPRRFVQDRRASAMLLPITDRNSQLNNQRRSVIRPSLHPGILTIKFNVNGTPASSLHHCETTGLSEGSENSVFPLAGLVVGMD